MPKPKISKELVNEVEKQYQLNIRKWGHQHPETLQPVLMEEIGEISKAYLQSYHGYEEATTKDLESEIIDAIAVLVELYQNIERWNYQNK